MNKTLLKICLLTILSLGAAFSSVPSLSQNTFKEAFASDTEIKPFADYEFNDSSKPGKDSSGNGFDLEVAGNNSTSTCAVKSSSYLEVINPSNATEGPNGVYKVATDGKNLYAPQLGNSGYDFSDMITGSYTISFKAKFDPLVKNPANYVVSFGLYEDCFTFVPYTRKYGDKWVTIIELQFHNSGRDGLTHNSETTTSETGRVMDTLVSKYIIWGSHNDTDAVPSSVTDFKNNWHTFTVVGDAINNKGYLYIDGVKVTLTNANYNATYTDGVEVPNGIKLTDLTGKTGRSYTFSLGAQMTFNKGSGRQYGAFSMDYFKIYNCALSASNVASLHSSGKAYYENESNARYITEMYLDKLPSLDITDTNSVSSMIAGGKLPKIVKARLNDNSVVDMPVFWYDDPDDTAKKVHAIPSIGKKHNIKDVDEPDFASIEGIFNPSFSLYTLDYNYVVDLTYDPTEFTVSNIRVANTQVSLDDLPYEISYQRGNNTIVTFDVTLLRDHASLERVMYDGINRIGDVTQGSDKTKYSCKVYVTKGANIQLVMGIETGKITYYSTDPAKEGIPYGYSTYTYGGSEGLLDPEVINTQITPYGYVEGYYSDKACTQPFTKDSLDYSNPIDLSVYFKSLPLRSSYTLTVNSNDGGTVTGNKPIYDINDGSEPFLAKITVTPQTGYIVESINWNSEIINIGDNPDTEAVESATTSIYFEHSITVDTTLTVKFRKLNSYTINPLYGEGGKVRRLNYDDHGLPLDDGSFSDPYIEGEEIHIDIAPIGDYTIDSIEWDGVSIPLTPEQKSGGYSIGSDEIIYANKNYSLIVKFAAPKTYTISTNYLATNGTITGIEDEYKLNDFTNISLIPNTGYHIESVQWGKINLPIVTNEQGVMVINRAIEDNVQLIVNFAQDVYYDVTYVIRGGGSGIVQGLSSNYLKGSNLENVVVRANEGSYISQIMWGYTSVTITDIHEMDLSSCVVTSSSTKLTATFEENPKNIVTISQSGNGTITGKTAYEQNETVAEFTIVPASGYVLSDVKWNGTSVKDLIVDNVLNVDISSDSILIVKFTKESSGGDSTKDITYEITDETTHLNIGYTIYGLESNPTFIKGEDYDLYVAPKGGYSIVDIDIILGDSFVSVVPQENGLYLIHITDISGNVSFSVEVFNNKQYKATVYTDDIVSVTGINNGEYYEANKMVNLVFTAPVGHILYSININGNIIDIPHNAASFNYELEINSDVVITVSSTTSPSKVALVTQYDSGLGTVTGVDDEGYYPGEYAVLRATSKPGYIIYSISFNGNDIEVKDLKTFTFSGLINGGNNLVVITFSPENVVTIDYLANINEGGTHSELDIYNLGDTTNIVVKANEGYLISDVIWNNNHIMVADEKNITIKEVIDTNKVEIIVRFSKISTYVVSADFNSDMGDVSGIKKSYFEGESTDIKITANSGYCISYISFNGKKIVPDNTSEYSLKENVIDNSELIVVYGVKSLDMSYVSLLVTDGGTVEDFESGYVLTNSDVTLNVSANEGYFISKILFNGEEIEIENNKSMEVNVSISSDSKIDVIFASNSISEIGGCANSITGSAVMCGTVLTALAGVIIIKKRKEK